MSPRAPLVWIVAVRISQLALSLVLEQLRTPLFERLDALEYSDPDRHAIYDQLDTLNAITRWSYLALGVVMLAGIALFAWSWRGRPFGLLAWVAAGFYGADLLLSAIRMSIDIVQDDAWTLVEALMTAEGLLRSLADVSVLVVATSVIRTKGVRVAVIATYSLLASALFALGVWSRFVLDYEHDRALMEALDWPWRISAYTMLALFIGALVASAVSVRPGEAPREAAAPATGRGAAVRLLVWAMLARVVAGVLGTAATGIGIAQGAPVGVIVILTMIAATICAAVAGIAIVRLLRGSELDGSGAAFVMALVAMFFAAVLDVWISVNAMQLVELAAEMHRATSFWNMPSLREIEQKQAIVTWGGRLAQIAGATAVVSLCVAFRRSAQHLEWADGERTASSAAWMCIVAVAGAIGLGLLAPIARDALPVLGLFALMLLALGIAFLVVFVRLALELARRLDDHATPDDPA